VIPLTGIAAACSACRASFLRTLRLNRLLFSSNSTMSVSCTSLAMVGGELGTEKRYIIWNLNSRQSPVKRIANPPVATAIAGGATSWPQRQHSSCQVRFVDDIIFILNLDCWRLVSRLHTSGKKGLSTAFITLNAGPDNIRQLLEFQHVRRRMAIGWCRSSI
jgi:hypothetical protein